MRTHVATTTLAILLASSALARADEPVPTVPPDPAQAASAPPPTSYVAPQVDDSMRKAQFSGGRMVAEILAGGLVGTLAGMAAYSGAGGDIGGALAGLGLDFAITPLVVWGTGKLFGGSGSLGYTYLGAAVAFSAPATSPEDAAIALSVGVVLMPVTASVMYELTSHVAWKKWQMANPGLSLAPIVTHGRIAGAGAQFAVAF